MKLSKTNLFSVLALLAALTACKPKAAELAGDAYPVASASGTPVSIDTTASVIKWTGSKVTGSHNGTVMLKSGQITTSGETVTSGKIVIDMATITDLDLQGEWKAKLEGHLKDTDFFEVAKFPEGIFEIASVTPTETGVEVRGNLTLRGITKGISFPATVVSEGGKVKSATGTAEINRQQWGIVYKGQVDDLISDMIKLEFNLVTK